jgi:hypothetical protein
MRQPVAAEAARSSMSGVLPMLPMNPCRMSMATLYPKAPDK